MMPLYKPLKKAATDAFTNNALVDLMSAADREQAAQWYEDCAAEVGGDHAALARLYNPERAKFLRRQVKRIPGTAPDFAREIGMRRLENTMTHKHQEGDQVVLLEDFTDYLPAGSLGVIFCLYTTTPPAYEVNFAATTGQLVGNVFYEDEIEAAHQALFPIQREAAGVNL